MRFDPHVVRRTIGRYRLTRRLGRGAAGMVFRAVDLDRHRTVALKILYHLYDEEAVVRFKNEVRTMQQLNHFNIVRALSTTVRSCGGSFYYFPMELVRGHSLEDFMLQQGSLEL